MKLIELLIKLKCNVKIGAKSGFVYCHKIDNDTVDELNAVSYTEKKKFKEELSNLKAYLDRFEDYWKSELRKRINVVLLANDNKVTDKMKREIKQEWLDDKNKSYTQSTKRLATLNNFLNNWKPIPDREVKECYDSIDYSEPKETKIILVDGLEIGKYWTTSEYEKGVVEYE